MAKYKVGDKVRVRSDLKEGELYGDIFFVSQMSEYKGKTVTISYVDKDGYYHIEEDAFKFYFSDGMFEDCRKFHVDDRVRIRQWDDMEREFGLNEHGSIDCRCGFSKPMKHLCGRTANITEIWDKTRIKLNFDDKSDDIIWNYSTDMIEPLERKFHVYDTVKHFEYGIGTVIEIDDGLCLVDFDEWNEDFLITGRNNNSYMCMSKSLTLVQSYEGD